MVFMSSISGHKDLVCVTDIAINHFNLITVPMTSRTKPTTLEDGLLKGWPSHYLIIQHKYIERLSWAMHFAKRSLRVKISIAGEFELPPIMDELHHSECNIS